MKKINLGIIFLSLTIFGFAQENPIGGIIEEIPDTSKVTKYIKIPPEGKAILVEVEELRDDLYNLGITVEPETLTVNPCIDPPNSIWGSNPGILYTAPCATKVGINTSSPKGFLDIRGVYNQTGIYTQVFRKENYALDIWYRNASLPTFRVKGDGVVSITSFISSPNAKTFSISDENGTDVFRILKGGAVYATEYHAYAKGNFPDYVFHSGYNLMPLKDLEAYINQFKHLPNIPSASEVEETGYVDLAEMQRLQMEKIEELTLYIIELNKKLEEANKKIEALQDK